MVGDFELAVLVVDGLAVFGEFQAVVGGLHGVEGFLSVRGQGRGYHLQIGGGNGGLIGRWIGGAEGVPRPGATFGSRAVFEQTTIEK